MPRYAAAVEPNSRRFVRASSSTGSLQGVVPAALSLSSHRVMAQAYSVSSLRISTFCTIQAILCGLPP
jgi:hypothetical protein